MPLEMFDNDSDEDSWCDDVWDIWLPPPRLRPIYEKIGKSLDEILEMEAEIINECTDIDPENWIQIYAQRFREIMTDDPTLTKSLVKRLLYCNK